jgi:hypothetical protein
LERDEFYAGVIRDQAKEIAKAAAPARRAAVALRRGDELFFACRVLHRICTRHPQLFHTRQLRRPILRTPTDRETFCGVPVRRLTYNAILNSR